MPIYCIEVSGSIYGCSRKIEDALAALQRGRRRGVSWGEIVERKNVPRGMRMNEWLTPFDGTTKLTTKLVDKRSTSHMSRIGDWTQVRREVRQDLDKSGVTPDTGMDRAQEILAGIPPIVLGKTKYRVIHGDERSLDLIGPRGGSSALVQSRNDPTAWAHNSMAGHTLKTVWYRKNPDFTFTRVDS